MTASKADNRSMCHSGLTTEVAEMRHCWTGQQGTLFVTLSQAGPLQVAQMENVTLQPANRSTPKNRHISEHSTSSPIQERNCISKSGQTRTCAPAGGRTGVRASAEKIGNQPCRKRRE